MSYRRQQNTTKNIQPASRLIICFLCLQSAIRHFLYPFFNLSDSVPLSLFPLSFLSHNWKTIERMWICLYGCLSVLVSQICQLCLFVSVSIPEFQWSNFKVCSLISLFPAPHKPLYFIELIDLIELNIHARTTNISTHL